MYNSHIKIDSGQKLLSQVEYKTDELFQNPSNSLRCSIFVTIEKPELVSLFLFLFTFI